MAEFVPINRRAAQELAPGQHLDLTFSPLNPGNITVVASAKWARTFPLDPTARTVSLHAPRTSSPVKTVADEGLSIATLLVHEMTAAQFGQGGNWKARVTNREDSTESFSLSVSFPGTVEIQTLPLPGSLVDGFLNSSFGRMRIRLHDGTNASFIDFPAEFNVARSTFTIVGFKRTINLPFPIPDMTITERVNDINSESITSSLRNAAAGILNGAIRLVIMFEESGREIVGTFAANMSGMKLTVDLPLIARSGKISYDTSQVVTDFQANVDLVNAPDFVLDPIFGYSKQIRGTVEQRVKSMFGQPATRDAFEKGIGSVIASKIPGETPQIHSVKVSGGNLVIRYTT
jgi:hypothetical protein